MTRLPLLIAALALFGCNKDSKLNQSDCGEQECPLGTAPSEYRADRQGVDISGGVDPATYSGEVAFATYGESECQYQCVAYAPCTGDSFPVITADCYACAVLNPEGEIAQPDCNTGGGQTMAVDTGY